MKHRPAELRHRDLDRPAVQLQDRPREREPEPEAPVTTGTVGVLERVEQLLALGARRRPAGHLHVDAQVGRPREERRADVHGPLLREADGALDDGRERLHEPRPVRVQPRDARLDLRHDLDVRIPRPGRARRARPTSRRRRPSSTRRHPEWPASTRAESMTVWMSVKSSRPRCSMMARLSRCPPVSGLRETRSANPRMALSGPFRSWLIDARNRPRMRSVAARASMARSCAEANSRNTPPSESTGVHEQDHGVEPGLAPHARSTQDVGRAGLSDRARRDRDVGGEDVPQAGAQRARERGPEDGEQPVHPQDGAEARCGERQVGVAVVDRHLHEGRAGLAAHDLERSAVLCEARADPVGRRGRERGRAPLLAGADEVQGPLRELGRLVLAGRHVEGAHVRLHEERGAERDEGHRHGDREDEAAPDVRAMGGAVERQQDASRGSTSRERPRGPSATCDRIMT